MTGLTDGAEIDAAVEAHFMTWARMMHYIPGAYTREGGAGTRLMVTTIPDPVFNVVSVGYGRDLREVEAFAQEIAAAGVPWGFQVRGDADPELKQLAARYGRTGTSTSPLMRWDAGSLPAQPPALPDGATVRKIAGKDSEEYAAALAAGFGVPQNMARLISMPGMLDAPGISAFVLDLRGEAVATGTNVMAGDYAGMYSGSVPPGHRRNGYYRALVTARLADAVARGARYALSTNTPMSRSLFAALGFRVALTWTYLLPGKRPE